MRAFAEALEAVPELPDTIPRDSHVAVRTSSPGSADAPGRMSTPQLEVDKDDLVVPAPPPMTASVGPATESSLTPAEVVGEITLPGGRSPRLLMQRVYAPLAAAVVLIGAFISALVLARPDRVSPRDGEQRSNAEQAPAAATPRAPSLDAPAVGDVAPAAAKQEPAPADPLSRSAAAEPRVASTPASPELVTVRVSTRPSGAKLSLAGGAQVCAETPCEVEVLRGKPVSFLARRGKQRAMTTVEPRDGAQVLLVLDASAARNRAEAEPPVEAEDDLKVPAAFR